MFNLFKSNNLWLSHFTPPSLISISYANRKATSKNWMKVHPICYSEAHSAHAVVECAWLNVLPYLFEELTVYYKDNGDNYTSSALGWIFVFWDATKDIKGKNFYCYTQGQVFTHRYNTHNIDCFKKVKSTLPKRIYIPNFYQFKNRYYTIHF